VPDSGPPPPQPSPAAAELDVKILPWCDLAIDGTTRGRSPTTLSVPPGHHQLVCSQPDGTKVELALDLAPGEHHAVRQSLFAAVDVRVAITRADVLIDGTRAAANASLKLAPGPHRVELSADGKIVASEYVQIPTHACVLEDTPQLHCHEPRP
jgi:hypothetical protein